MVGFFLVPINLLHLAQFALETTKFHRPPGPEQIDLVCEWVRWSGLNLPTMKLFRAVLTLVVPLALTVPLRAADPAPAKAKGFTFIKTRGGILNYRLEANGLDVLLLPDHSAPVVTFMITYHVGSRNEVTGTTGATHLLEHLMFKGSKHYHAGRGNGFDTMLDGIGAANNATTSLDRTNYYEDVPSDHLELAVQLEADRIRGLLLREEDRRPEMTVVRNEFERGENEPTEALSKEINAAAFLAHPYHHPTIGWRSDIEKVSIEKLRSFYDTFYWPNNATVTIIGDFEPVAALGLLKKYYGAIPRSPHSIPQIYTEEPPQQGPRRVRLRRPGELGVVSVAYKVPNALQADTPALMVLGDILADGKTSRFYRALTDKSLTLSVEAGKDLTHDATLFSVTARLAPEATHEQVEKVILAEIEALKRDGVTAAEVARALSKENASTAYGRDGTSAIAAQINEDIAVGDWTYFLTLPEKIKAVTVADVNRVARAYLVEDQSTTGWFVPVADGAVPAEKTGGTKRRPLHHPEFYRAPEAGEESSVSIRARPGSRSAGGAVKAAEGKVVGAAQIAPRIVRRKVAGLDVLTLKTSLRDAVTLRGSLPAGDVFNPVGRSGLADLTAAMLDQGTAKRDKFALAQLLEDVGALIHFETSSHNLTFSARCLKQDVPLVLSLLAEQLRTPAFSAEEFGKVKKQLVGRYQQQLEDTNFRAREALARAIFPVGHPNHPPAAAAYLADITAATLEELKAFHAAHYGPQGFTLVAVGDVDDVAINDALKTAFAGWTGGQPLPAAPKHAPLSAARVEKINMPGKASISVLVGLGTGLKYSDADHLALAAASEIFGGGYFTSRLLAIVRNQEGLTYGIGARLGADAQVDGQWGIAATFAPELLEQGLASTRRELQRFTAAGVSAQELAQFKITMVGSYKLSLATSAGLASQILATVQRGLPLAQLDDFAKQVESLTFAQVNGAVKKYLPADKMITVLAGTLPGAAK